MNRLAGLSRVYEYDLTPESLGLVLKEALELSEAPRVKSAAGLPMIDLYPVPNVRKVFKHDGSACIHIPDNRTGDDVVAIPSEALFTPSEASEMPFGRLRAFGLVVAG